MNWKKLGKIFCASGQNYMMMAGGHAPIPLHLENDIYRIYFGSYDNIGRGRIFYLEIDIKFPQDILRTHIEPVVDFSELGYYDDNGIIPSDILSVNGKEYLYTIGFSVKNKFTFEAATGLAISRDHGLCFDKLRGPVLTMSVEDPCFASSPCVLHLDSLWHIWYVSGERWDVVDGERRHYYNIKHRTSCDGIHWNFDATTCIDFANEYEYAIARPSVFVKNGLWRMWYCFRAQKDVSTYRIGYAESGDGINWTRKDDEMRSFGVSADGWDSQMLCYPRVFEHKDRLYMLYNGNGYGKSGFGLAVLEAEERERERESKN